MWQGMNDISINIYKEANYNRKEMKEEKKEKDWPNNIGVVQVFKHRDAI